MAPDLSELSFLLYLLPGFISYCFAYRLLLIEKEKDTFDTTLFSLFLSLLIYAGLVYLDSIQLISLVSIDWRALIACAFLIIIMTFLSVCFDKYVLPRLEKFTQRFDFVKSSTKDVFTDIISDKTKKEKDLVEVYGIYLKICTNDDRVYTGYLNRQGLFNDGKKGIYLKDVLLLNGVDANYNLGESDGVLFLEDQIKWISILKYNFNSLA